MEVTVGDLVVREDDLELLGRVIRVEGEKVDVDFWGKLCSVPKSELIKAKMVLFRNDFMIGTRKFRRVVVDEMNGCSGCAFQGQDCLYLKELIGDCSENDIDYVFKELI